MAGGRKKQRTMPSSKSPLTNTARTPPQLKGRYNFTPASEIPQPQTEVHKKKPSPSVRDYPPPEKLFQNSNSPLQQETSPAVSTRRRPQELQPQRSQEHQPQRSQEHQRQRSSPHFQSSPQFQISPQLDSSPHSAARTQTSRFGGEDDSDAEDYYGANLAEDQMALLKALLMKPGREEYTTVLSPTPMPNTTWFDRDKGSLTRKITKIFTNKFNGLFYSWSCVPRDRQERFFVEFAKTHTWDILITGVVQQEFETVCKRRMKDMVSTVRTTRVRPGWISETLFLKMCEYWDTEEATEKSQTTSTSRLSERGGLGPHKHYGGQKSSLQVKQEMEIALKRAVSLGEVFIKTHTKPDGTYVDRKAETVAEAYMRNLAAKKSELAAANSEMSDGTSRQRGLTIDEEDDLFLQQSTFTNERGTIYGIGNLADHYINGKRKIPGISSSFQSLQQQLQDTQRRMEEQAAESARLAAESARREEELIRVSSQQQSKLSLVEKFLATDPNFLAFLQTQSAPSTSASGPTTSTTPADNQTPKE